MHRKLWLTMMLGCWDDGMKDGFLGFSVTQQTPNKLLLSSYAEPGRVGVGAEVLVKLHPVLSSNCRPIQTPVTPRWISNMYFHSFFICRMCLERVQMQQRAVHRREEALRLQAGLSRWRGRERGLS